MRDELASLVHPVFVQGLALKERLDRGEEPHLETEQAALVGMLLSESESKRVADFGGDTTRPTLADVSGSDAPRPLGFQGARYALVCWLDELFVRYSSWAERWNEHKLEVSLYASNDRAWKFWEQARLAATRSSSDVLETYFLCAALGFRGDLDESPEQLGEWLAATRAQLARGLAREWVGPPDLEPVTHVPPLQGRSRLRRMVLAAGAAVLLLVPSVVIFLVLTR